MASDRSARRGALLVFEGIDRCGKSTQCSRLVEHLNNSNVPAELWRFPDRSNLTGGIINSYLESKLEMADEAIHLLFAANRWENRQKILDKLASGTTLVVDRYAFSGIVYSMAKQRNTMSLQWLKMVEANLPAPDAVFYMKISPEESAKRGGYGQERYEKTEFQTKVAQCFDKVIEGDERWAIINAAQPIEAISAEIQERVTGIMAGLQNASLPGNLYEAHVQFKNSGASTAAQDIAVNVDQTV